MENKNFKELYLKYKFKYINLKNSQQGGDDFNITEFINLNSADNSEIVTSIKNFISNNYNDIVSRLFNDYKKERLQKKKLEDLAKSEDQKFIEFVFRLSFRK